MRTSVQIYNSTWPGVNSAQTEVSLDHAGQEAWSQQTSNEVGDKSWYQYCLSIQGIFFKNDEILYIYTYIKIKDDLSSLINDN